MGSKSCLGQFLIRGCQDPPGGVALIAYLITEKIDYLEYILKA